MPVQKVFAMKGLVTGRDGADVLGRLMAELMAPQMLRSCEDLMMMVVSARYSDRALATTETYLGGTALVAGMNWNALLGPAHTAGDGRQLRGGDIVV